MKRNVIIIYGGNSVEHDISIITATQAIKCIDCIKYKLFPIYMRGGEFYLKYDYNNFSSYDNFDTTLYPRVVFARKSMSTIKGSKLKSTIYIDNALICCHGGLGENGCLQGMLDIYDIPYTSAGVMGASVGMNKNVTKLIANSLGIPTVKGLKVDPDTAQEIDDSIFELLGQKVICKPNSLGSSIAINVCENIKELKSAIELVGLYDNYALVENYLENAAEYNCSLYIEDKKLIVGKVERVNNGNNDYLTFDDKYVQDNNTKGMAGGKRVLLDSGDNIVDTVIQYSELIYRALELKGVVRIDYLEKDNNVYFNEINIIPGSLAYYLYENSFSELIDKWLLEAICLNEKDSIKIKGFKSNTLSRQLRGKKVRN